MEPGRGCSWAGGGVTVFCETYPVSLIDTLWLTSTFPVKIPVLIITKYNINICIFLSLQAVWPWVQGGGPVRAQLPLTHLLHLRVRDTRPLSRPAQSWLRHRPRSGRGSRAIVPLTSDISALSLHSFWIFSFGLCTPLFSFLSTFSIPSLTLPPPYPTPFPTPSPTPHPPSLSILTDPTSLY